jgi:hypothetical protein
VRGSWQSRLSISPWIHAWGKLPQVTVWEYAISVRGCNGATAAHFPDSASTASASDGSGGRERLSSGLGGDPDLGVGGDGRATLA